MKISGLLLYDKPAGPTSYRALGAFRKAFPGCRVGHAGTLDSFATGLLVLLAGSYSRLAPAFVGLDKHYLAELSLGAETDTLDPLGRVVAEGPPATEDALRSALPAFTGPIMQVPPKYSAIHVNGARASDLAIRGREFELPPRPVTIFSLGLESFASGKATISVHCSSGTYIRSLARDLGRAAGSFAHLVSLRRLAVGPFSVMEAETAISPETTLRYIDPVTARSIGLSVASIGEDREQDFANGKPSALSCLENQEDSDGDCAVFSHHGLLLGMVGRSGGQFSYKVVLSGSGGSM